MFSGNGWCCRFASTCFSSLLPFKVYICNSTSSYYADLCIALHNIIIFHCYDQLILELKVCCSCSWCHVISSMDSNPKGHLVWWSHCNWTIVVLIAYRWLTIVIKSFADYCQQWKATDKHVNLDSFRAKRQNRPAPFINKADRSQHFERIADSDRTQQRGKHPTENNALCWAYLHLKEVNLESAHHISDWFKIQHLGAISSLSSVTI
jgi:hypothetical protein